MLDTDFRVCLDIGNSKVVAMVTKHNGQNVEVIALATEASDEASGPSYENPTLVSETLRSVIKEVGQQSGLTIKRAYVSVGSDTLQSFNKQDVLVRSSAVRVVTDDDISMAMRTASKIDLPPDRQLLHVIPRKYQIGGIEVLNPVGMHADNLPIETHAITVSTQEVVTLQDIVRDSGISPDFMIAKPIATSEALLTSRERQDSTAVVDLGSDSTGIAVFYNGSIHHTTTVPVGCFHMTNDISIAFSITFEEAHKIKISYGEYIPERFSQNQEITVHPTQMQESLVITKREISYLLKDRLEELIKMIKIRLDVPELENVTINNFIVTGGGVKLKGCKELFQQILDKDIRIAQVTQSENVDNKLQDPIFSTVYGMALWAGKNLPVPKHVNVYKEQQSITQPKPQQGSAPPRKQKFLSGLFRRRKDKK